MQEKQILEEKAREQYVEWYRKKCDEEKEERLKIKQERDWEQNKLCQKKISAENAYKLWLRENKRKSRKENGNNFRNINNKIKSPINLYTSASPTFVNPLPWVGATVEREDNDEICSNNNKQRHNKNKNDYNEDFSSPPLLWEEVEKRQQQKRLNTRRKKSKVS